MTEYPDRSCADCGGSLHEIMVVDKGHFNQSTALEYAAIDAKPSLWTSKVPIAGAVKAFTCSQCGLIKFYSVPKS